MKRAWTYLLVLCLLLPCAADAAKARDASGVTVSGGRLRGDRGRERGKRRNSAGPARGLPHTCLLYTSRCV